MNTNELWQEAVEEAKAAQERMALDLYINKLETALNAATTGNVGTLRIMDTLGVLDGIHPKLSILERVRILRAAFGLTLDEAKAHIADWEGENDLPF